jgi:hypothetical protein
LSTNIADLSGIEIVHNVCPRPAGIFDIIDDPFVAFEYCVGFFEQCVIDEFRDEATAGCIVLVRPIAVDRSDPDCFRAEEPSSMVSGNMAGSQEIPLNPFGQK